MKVNFSLNSLNCINKFIVILTNRTMLMKHNFTKLRKIAILIGCFFMLSAVFAQERTITGTVTSYDDGSTLPGVNVVVKGTTIGTITDIDGKYSITIPEDATILMFSFVGMTLEEVEIAGNTVVDMVMVADIYGLDEVVVVGYGIQRKREIVGSISKIESKNITDKVTPSFESALSGQAAGVQVITGSGLAGSASTVRIRGIASIGASGDPLYVIDGVPITNDIFGIAGRTDGMNINPLSSINPEDIESVEILKDAAATGIYGSRGSNGVIIITTKRGQKGKTSIDFSSRFGFVTPTKKIEMTNSQEWLQLYQEAWENDGNVGPPPSISPAELTWEEAKQNDTDWWDEVTEMGMQQEYNLSGNTHFNNFSLYVGGSYSTNESYMIGNSINKLSGRVNLDYSVENLIDVKLSTSLSQAETDLTGNAWEGGIAAAMSEALPIYPIYNEDGDYFKGGGWVGNPLMVSNLKDMRNNEQRSFNNLSVTYKPLVNLNVNVNGGMDYMDFRHDVWIDPYLGGYDHIGRAEQQQKNVLNYNYNAIASYIFKMPKNHSLTGMIGHEYQRSSTTGKWQNVDDVKAALDTDPRIDKTRRDRGDDADQEWAFISYFGRANYSFKDKYIAQFSLRTDGSSNFGSNYRYGYFPTVGLGWVLSDEEFLKNNSIISWMKFKVSWGITGNANIPNYQWLGTYSEPSATLEYNGAPIIYPNRYENPDLKWETTDNYDIALESRFLQDRIETEIAYYYKESSDVLVSVSKSQTTGFGSRWENIATIMNKGIEFSLKSRNLIGDFKWTTQFNIASLKNEVLDVGGLLGEIGGGTNDTRIYVGQPVGVNTLVLFSRIDPADGRPIYLTADGYETKDYIFDPASPDDMRVPAGKVIPDFQGGLTNTFNYKGFSMNFLFTFSYGAKIFDSSAKRQMGLLGSWNLRKDIYDRWQQPGDVASYPRLSTDYNTYGGENDWFNTTMWLFDGDYIRLKDLTLAYSFKNDYLKNVRIYVSGTNLLTFTNYPGADPEVARDYDSEVDRNLSPNVSWLTPPQARVYSIGINLTY